MSFEITNANGKTWLYESYNLGYMEPFDCRMDAIDALRRLTGKPVIGREPSSEPTRKAFQAIANNRRAEEYRKKRRELHIVDDFVQPITWKWTLDKITHQGYGDGKINQR